MKTKQKQNDVPMKGNTGRNERRSKGKRGEEEERTGWRYQGRKNEWEYDGVIGMEPNKKEGGGGRQAGDEEGLPFFFPLLPTYLLTTQATAQRQTDLSSPTISRQPCFPASHTIRHWTFVCLS